MYMQAGLKRVSDHWWVALVDLNQRKDLEKMGEGGDLEKMGEGGEETGRDVPGGGLAGSSAGTWQYAVSQLTFPDGSEQCRTACVYLGQCCLQKQQRTK